MFVLVSLEFEEQVLVCCVSMFVWFGMLLGCEGLSLFCEKQHNFEERKSDSYFFLVRRESESEKRREEKNATQSTSTSTSGGGSGSGTYC